MTISAVEVIPLATDVDASEDELTVSLADGRRISVPLAWFPRLLDATDAQRAEFRLIGDGEGIHWPGVDEDVSVAGLLRGARAFEVQHERTKVGVEYRRAEQGDRWHWCDRCSSYPTENYFTRQSRPAADPCEECTAKEKANPQ